MGQGRSETEWHELVRELESSGTRAEEFARRRGVNAKTLMWWRSRVRRQARETGPAAVRLVELRPVAVSAPTPSPGGTVSVFVGGVRVGIRAGFDPATLSAVLEVLEARSRGRR